jgi:oligopeptide/dipeptide ABC transporter ATP-binding protein
MKKELILKIEDLHTSFTVGQKVVDIIKGVSFELYKGETLAIVGESGCGKSVTVHSILQLLPPNGIIKKGNVTYYDRADKETFELSKLPKYGPVLRKIRGKKIGMVFQDPMTSLNPVYRVGDQVAERLLQNFKMTKSEAIKAVVEMFEKLGIPDPENRIYDYPHQFSGGMKQRVVIATAFICNPEIIIADEPTTALDVTTQAQIMDLMKEFQIKDNKALILITHNMGLVADMADRVAVMYMGRIVEYGSVKDIFTNPSHPYTKALLKSVPVLGNRKNKILQTIPGITPNPADIGFGCEFADRCQHAKKECRLGAIKNYKIAPNHAARCILFKHLAEVK